MDPADILKTIAFRGRGLESIVVLTQVKATIAKRVAWRVNKD